MNLKLNLVGNSTELEVLKSDGHGFEVTKSDSLEICLKEPSAHLYILGLNSIEFEEKKDLLKSLTKRSPNAKTILYSDDLTNDQLRMAVIFGIHQVYLKEDLLKNFAVIVDEIKYSFEEKSKMSEIIVGSSCATQKLVDELVKLKPYKHLNVLIEGDSGVGKELCAQALALGVKNFVSLNLATLPETLIEAELFGSEKGSFTGSTQSREGYFEKAQGGVLFLDEIQSLPLSIQVKLLRVLETKKYFKVGSTVEKTLDTRIVSASNEPLKKLIENGMFRQDLYYRLAHTTVKVKALRERREDIPLLIEKMSRKSFTPEALNMVVHNYNWPGNVRELKNFVMECNLRSAIPVIHEDLVAQLILVRKCQDMIEPIATGAVNELMIDWSLDYDGKIAQFEKFLFQESIKKVKDSHEAMQMLKIARSRYYERLKRFNIDPIG